MGHVFAFFHCTLASVDYVQRRKYTHTLAFVQFHWSVVQCVCVQCVSAGV